MVFLLKISYDEQNQTLTSLYMQNYSLAIQSKHIIKINLEITKPQCLFTKYYQLKQQCC